jgi:uncharacterized protein (UPF0262 family)
MQEYANLITVTFDINTLPDADASKTREVLLMADDLQKDACLYPVAFEDIPALNLIMCLENHKFKLAFTKNQSENKDDTENDMVSFIISFSPYVSFIREYKEICNSYKNAIVHDNIATIETIDMARRGLHNQAADLMQSRLHDKIHGNHQAFRHLFSIMTLVL